jgi:hypothetical protein
MYPHQAQQKYKERKDSLYRYSVFPASFIEETVLSSMYFLVPFL